MSTLPHQYKVGDRVKTKSGYKGVIKTATGHYSDGTPIYYVDFDHNWMGSDVMRETDLLPDNDDMGITPYVSGSYIASKCECGASHTSFEHIHSTWCPKYERY